MLYKCLTCSGNSVFLWRHAKDSLINVFRTRMCGQTLLFIVIANCAIAFISQLKHAAANLAARLCSPIAFANNTKRSITQLSKQAQIFLIDQTSQTVVHVVLVWRGFDQCSCCWLVRWASFLFRRRRSKWYLRDSIKHMWSLCATIKQQYLCWTAQELHIHKTFTIKSCVQYAQLCMYNQCTIYTTMN